MLFYIGKGIGGGIAAEVADYIRNEKNDNSDIYCYTFGSPKTHIGPKIDTDSFIKNIINEDDYLTKVLTEDNAYRKGDEYNASINSDFRYNHRNLTRNSPKYTGDYMKVNSINEKIKEYKKKKPLPQNLLDDLALYLNKRIGRATNTVNDFVLSKQDVELKDIITAYESHSNNQEFETASSVGAYWTLAKCLEGLDEKKINHRSYNKIIEQTVGERWDYEIIKIVDTIKDLGVWYVNHVATYQTDLRESRGTTVAKEYYDDNINENTYPMDGDERLSNIDSETIIKKGSTKYYYFYNPFAGFETSNDEGYKEDGTNRNYLKRYLGDDCSGFVQGIVYTFSNGNRGQVGDNPNVLTDTTGLWNHNVNAGKLVSDSTYDTENSMMRLGWQKYYVQGNEWKRKRIKYDGTIENKTLKEIYNNPDYTMSSDFLEPGDLLCSNSHVEFYVGYNYEVDYFDKYNEAGEIIEQTDDEKKKNGIESIEIDSKSSQGYSIFAWGNVQNEFPKQNYYFTYDSANRVFRLNYSSASSDGKSYKVIWRKN